MQVIAEAAASRAVGMQTEALRSEMRQISESSAELMASKISAELNSNMQKMEMRLRERIDLSIRENLGMSRDDHVQQHRQLNEIVSTYRTVNRTVWSNIIKALATIGFVGWLGSGAQLPAIVQKSPVDRQVTAQAMEGGQ